MLLTLLALVAWTEPDLQKIQDGSRPAVQIGETCDAPGAKTISTVVAKSPAARAKGLSGRKKPLAANEGMLFLFDPPQRVFFWMKETYIPLHIVFFDSNGRVVHHANMPVEPDPLNPYRRYGPETNVAVALEVAPSTFAKVQNGQRLCIGI